jgi:hypothetical protein
MERSNYDKIFQTCDGGYRFGIMTTNGSESLNAVFKDSRMLPVAALVEETFYKCNSWFVQRRQAAMEQSNAQKPFSERVHVKLAKRWEKATKMDVIAYSHGEGKYEVTGPDEYVPVVQTQDGTMSYLHRRFQYIVTFGPNRAVECTCRGIQLTGIPCAHVLAVCRITNWDPNLFVADWYKVDYLMSTWNALFVPYGNPEDWPTTTTPTIEPNKDWIRHGRRKHIRHVMTMDEMQGRRRGHRPRRSTTDRQSRGM